MDRAHRELCTFCFDTLQRIECLYLEGEQSIDTAKMIFNANSGLIGNSLSYLLDDAGHCTCAADIMQCIVQSSPNTFATFFNASTRSDWLKAVIRVAQEKHDLTALPQFYNELREAYFEVYTENFADNSPNAAAQAFEQSINRAAQTNEWRWWCNAHQISQRFIYYKTKEKKALMSLANAHNGVALVDRKCADRLRAHIYGTYAKCQSTPSRYKELDDINRAREIVAKIGASRIFRRRLDVAGAILDFPILEKLRAKGATDYVALPMVFSDGRINVMTLASDRQGGLTTAELRTIAEMMPVLARLMEMHALRRTAKTVLETYLGHLTGERVLAGLIHRGEGEDIHAVIWLCDLRGSTVLADRLPRRAFLELLNDYFECMAGAVLAHRGEVLKFIGDAMLAIFPIGAVTKHPEECPQHARACAGAIAGAREAIRMADLNQQRAERREPPLRFGIALHLGDVMYGNVGAPGRLDFTVVGPAVNEAARLEAMCKTLARPLVISAEFARVLLPQPLVSLGVHALRGVRRRHELFTLAEVV